MLGIFEDIIPTQLWIRKELNNMDILIGLVLFLIAMKLLIELGAFFLGYKIIKDLTKKDD